MKQGVCPKCGMSFAVQLALAMHLEGVHRDSEAMRKYSASYVPEARTSPAGQFDSFRQDLGVEVCRAILGIGVDARVSKEDPAAVEIAEGPIRRITAYSMDYHSEHNSYEGGVSHQSSHYEFLTFEVLDPRISTKSPNIGVRSIRKKALPLFGPVIGVKWRGAFGELDEFYADIREVSSWDREVTSRIALYLSQDTAVREAIISAGEDVIVRTEPEDAAWFLSSFGDPEISPPTWFRKASNRRLIWDCYQAIAQCLLAMPIPTDKQSR